jgi:hypothetical protein
MFFLRHLANMSCMVPFWASTGSGFVLIWGPSPKPPCPEEVVYSLNDSCSHLTQRLSLQNFLSNIHRLFLTVHATSFISFIHHIYTHIYTFYLHVSFIISLLQIFMAGRLPLVPCVQYRIYCLFDERFYVKLRQRRAPSNWHSLLMEESKSQNVRFRKVTTILSIFNPNFTRRGQSWLHLLWSYIR